MEPASILSAASAISAVAGKAWELGSFIRELYQGAKTVDGKVRRLESAVTELARACEHVQGQFESMSAPPSSKTSALVWDEQGALTTSIDSQVKDCRKTLRELRTLLTDLRPSSSSFFGRTSRHIKLQDRTQQINDFSLRVKTHTDALQMSLQIVTIKVALATPDFLLQRLGTALEDLRVRLSRIENNTIPSTSQVAFGEAHGPPLLQRAREVLREGTTLYETSTAGSVADAEPMTGSERAARIKEWAKKMDGLRGDHDSASGVNRPSTVSAHVSLERGPRAESAEKPSDTSPVSVLDGTNSTNADNTRLTTASPSLHPSGRNSSTSCAHRSHLNKKTPYLEGITGKGKAANQDTSIPTELSPKDLDKANPKAERITFQHPMDTSSPLDQCSRAKVMKDWKIQINGELEARICTGNSVGPAILSKLAPANQAASTIRRPATTKLQPTANGLALLLAVFFRDIYLIKPLIEREYSPHADMVYSQDQDHCTPMMHAIGTRCEPVIRELLDNVPVLPCAYDYSLCRSLLNHNNLRRFPPAGVESIKRVIDLLMSARSSAHEACGCSRFQDAYDRSPCQMMVWQLIHGACNMPSHMHDYRLPLVTHLLQYISLPGDEPSYRVLHARLTTAVIEGLSTVVEFLITETTDDSLLQIWLRKNRFTSLLDLAIRRAKNLPRIPLDTVRVLLEIEADLEARNPGQTAKRSRKKAIDMALNSKRADLIALVEPYSKT
jgi:hypothetical protein